MIPAERQLHNLKKLLFVNFAADLRDFLVRMLSTRIGKDHVLFRSRVFVSVGTEILAKYDIIFIIRRSH